MVYVTWCHHHSTVMSSGVINYAQTYVPLETRCPRPADEGGADPDRATGLRRDDRGRDRRGGRFDKADVLSLLLRQARGPVQRQRGARASLARGGRLRA